MTARIAIVGSGPSGVYLLQHLVAQSREPIDVTVFESGDRAGIGSPYDPALNGPSLLANIACIEIPVVGETLTDWLRRRSDTQLSALEIDRSEIDRREFYPRVALGAYYEDRFDRLIVQAREAGHSVVVRTGALVVDVVAHPHAASLRWQNRDQTLHEARFDYIVVASGHRARGDWPTVSQCQADPLAPSTRLGKLVNARIGVLGTSLSGIDVAVSVAEQFGTFTEVEGELSYRPYDPAVGFHLTLMSRRGYLPEADFYCPIPYQPLDVCTPTAVAVACSGPLEGRLERLFDLLARQLEFSDPAYAERIGLAQCTPDSFAAAYFGEREAMGPFEFAKANLAEATANASIQRTIAWRYAILRMHERLGEAVPNLCPAEADRFRKGLGAVFIDNYAAVPHLSLERLLALHRAGRLDIERLGFDYAMTSDADGKTTVQTATQTLKFDHLIDARGQAPLTADELPFPTLRCQILANRFGEEAIGGEGDLTVEPDFALDDGINRLSRVYCLSIPHLLRRHPFIQGLTSCNELGQHVAEAILATAARSSPVAEPEELIDLIAVLDRTTVVEMPGSGTPMQVPRSADSDVPA